MAEFSQAGLLNLLMGSDAVRQLLDSLWTLATGGNPLDQSPVYWNPAQSLGTNYQSTRRTEQLLGMFGSAIKDATTYSGMAAARGFYQNVMGYDATRAAQAAQAGSPLQSILTGLLVEPEAKQAARRMGSSLLDRRSQWDQASELLGRDQIRTDSNWSAAGSELISRVSRAAVDGDFSGLGIGTSGELAARMIGAGQFDRRGGKGGENDEQRINRFGSTLRQYSRSIASLKEVIEGPLDDILGTFEEFTGSNLVSTSTGRVNAISEGMRNVLETGIITPGQLYERSIDQYLAIAPYGGTRMLAASQTLVNAAVEANMPGVEGVDKVDFRREQLKLNARMLANGTAQSMGAAYAWWKDQHTEFADDMAARSAFADEMRAQGGGDFNSGIANYLKNNNISASYRNSAAARSAMNNPELLALAQHDALINGYNRRVKDILTSSGLSAELLDNVYDPETQQKRIQAALELGGMSQGDARNRAADIQRQIGSGARIVTGANNEVNALSMVGAITGGVRQLEQNRAATTWGMISGEQVSQTGVAGMIQALQKKGLGVATIGDLLGSAFGIDPRLIRADVQNALTNGDPEGATDRASAAAIQAIMKKTGMSRSQAEQYAVTAMKNLGAAGVIGALAMKTGGDLQIAGGQRAELMEDIAAGQFDYSLAKYGELEMTADQRDALYLASTTKQGASTIKREDIEEFRKTKEAWIKEGKTEGEAAQIAATKQSIEQKVKAQRDLYTQSGKEIDEDAILNSVKEDIQAAGGLVGDDVAKGWAKKAITDVPNENILKQIYQLLCSRLKN